MNLDQEIIRQNQRALQAHDISVYEMALSKPFFLYSEHKETVKNPPKNMRAE